MARKETGLTVYLLVLVCQFLAAPVQEELYVNALLTRIKTQMLAPPASYSFAITSRTLYMSDHDPGDNDPDREILYDIRLYSESSKLRYEEQATEETPYYKRVDDFRSGKLTISDGTGNRRVGEFSDGVPSYLNMNVQEPVRPLGGAVEGYLSGVEKDSDRFDYYGTHPANMLFNPCMPPLVAPMEWMGEGVDAAELPPEGNLRVIELVRQDRHGNKDTLKLYVSPEQNDFIVKSEYRRDLVDRAGQQRILECLREVQGLQKDEQGRLFPAKYVMKEFRDGQLACSVEREYREVTIDKDIDDALFDLDVDLNPLGFPAVYDAKLKMRVSGKPLVSDIMSNSATVGDTEPNSKADEITPPALTPPPPAPSPTTQKDPARSYLPYMGIAVGVCFALGVGAIAIRRGRR